MFSDGYIFFINEEGTYKGWYDYNGNKVSIINSYSIIDIKDNKVILEEENEEDEYDEDEKIEFNYIIIDTTGKQLLNTGAIEIYEDFYLIKNNNNKMVLVDEELNVISNEYDRITTNSSMDVTPHFSSYY